MNSAEEIEGHSRQGGNDSEGRPTVETDGVGASSWARNNGGNTNADMNEDDYFSPRKLILQAKSSDEELQVPRKRVQSRHKWIQETLLKDAPTESAVPAATGAKSARASFSTAATARPSGAKPPSAASGRAPRHSLTTPLSSKLESDSKTAAAVSTISSGSVGSGSSASASTGSGASKMSGKSQLSSTSSTGKSIRTTTSSDSRATSSSAVTAKTSNIGRRNPSSPETSSRSTLERISPASIKRPSPTRVSTSAGDAALARARAAIDGRRKSREAAKARTNAVMTEIESSHGIPSSSNDAKHSSFIGGARTRSLSPAPLLRRDTSILPGKSVNENQSESGATSVYSISDTGASIFSSSRASSTGHSRSSSRTREMSAATMATLASLSARRSASTGRNNEKSLDRNIAQRRAKDMLSMRSPQREKINSELDKTPKARGNSKPVEDLESPYQITKRMDSAAHDILDVESESDSNMEKARNELDKKDDGEILKPEVAMEHQSTDSSQHHVGLRTKTSSTDKDSISGDQKENPLQQQDDNLSAVDFTMASSGVSTNFDGADSIPKAERQQNSSHESNSNADANIDDIGRFGQSEESADEMSAVLPIQTETTTLSSRVTTSISSSLGETRSELLPSESNSTYQSSETGAVNSMIAQLNESNAESLQRRSELNVGLAHTVAPHSLSLASLEDRPVIPPNESESTNHSGFIGFVDSTSAELNDFSSVPQSQSELTPTSANLAMSQSSLRASDEHGIENTADSSQVDAAQSLSAEAHETSSDVLPSQSESATDASNEMVQKSFRASSEEMSAIISDKSESTTNSFHTASDGAPSVTEDNVKMERGFSSFKTAKTSERSPSFESGSEEEKSDDFDITAINSRKANKKQVGSSSEALMAASRAAIDGLTSSNTDVSEIDEPEASESHDSSLPQQLSQSSKSHTTSMENESAQSEVKSSEMSLYDESDSNMGNICSVGISEDLPYSVPGNETSSPKKFSFYDPSMLSQQETTLSFDPLIGNSTFCTGGTAPGVGTNETNESTGQVDKLLFQEAGNVAASGIVDNFDQHHSTFTPTYEEDIDYEVSNATSYTSRDSDSRGSCSVPSPGPLWRQALEVAESSMKTSYSQQESVSTPSVGRKNSLGSKLATTKLTGRKLNSVVPPGAPKSLYNQYLEEEGDFSADTDIEPNAQDVVDLKDWKGVDQCRMVVMAVLGMLGGFFPSLYVQITCHFITGEDIVGDEDVEFDLHFGMWKYTPIDSAFQGYTYCFEYDSRYIDNIPLVPRIAGLVGLACGSIPLIVIWVYVSMSTTHRSFWIPSMWLLLLAFIGQSGTFLIFLLGLCKENECSMGPGAWASIMSAVSWLLLSVEMKANSPVDAPMLRAGPGVVLLEKNSPGYVSNAKRKWRKLVGKRSREWENVPSLSRVAMKKQKERIDAGWTGVDELEMGRHHASYRPPIV